MGERCYGIGYTTGKLRGVFDSSMRDKDGFATSVMAYKVPLSLYISLDRSVSLYSLCRGSLYPSLSRLYLATHPPSMSPPSVSVLSLAVL